MYLKVSTAATIMFGPFVSKADGFSLLTDSTTITDIDHGSTGIFLSKNGAAAAIRNATVTASVADAYGMMKVTLDTTDTNAVGTLDVLFAKAATYLPVHKQFTVLPAQVYDSLIAGSDLLDANASQLGNVTQSLTDLKDFADTGYDPSTHKVQGVVLADTVTTLTNMPAAAPSAATVAAAVWDLDATTHQTTGTFGQAIGDPGADTHTIYGAVVTDAAGVNIAADIATEATELAKVPKSDGSVIFNATCVGNIKSGLSTQAELDKVPKSDGAVKWNVTAVAQMNSNYEGGAVWIDTGGGAAGTTNYTHGTVTNPNSSIANARTIADSLNLNIFNVSNGSSLTLDQGYTNYQFLGERWTLALASRAIPGTHFQGATVSGLSTGTGSEWDDCNVGTATIANDSTFYNCGLNGTFTCQAAGIYNFIGCFSTTAAGVDWILDFAALGATTIALRDWRGGVEVRNMAAGDVLAVTGAGRITLAASCTAGTVQIAGLVNLINNGSGQTISDSARWNEDQRLANVTLVDTTTNLTNGVSLIDGAHGGAASVLTLKQLAITNSDAGGVAVRIQGTGAGNSHGIHVTSVNGKGLVVDAASDAVSLDSSAARGLVVSGATGDIVGDITGNVSGSVGSVAGLTPGTVADQVWEEAIADHSGTAGSVAASLAAAGSAGDPWLTPIPGLYLPGTAGAIVGTNLDVAVSTRAEPGADGDTLKDLSDQIDGIDTKIGTPLDLGLGATLAFNTQDIALLAQDSVNTLGTITDFGSGATVGANLFDLEAEIAAVPTAIENADALLDRNMATGADNGSSTVRTVRQALRFLRNKWSVAAGTLTVAKENDVDASWTATLTTDAAADPVTGSDPAGP